MTIPLGLFALAIHFVLWKKGFLTLPRGQIPEEALRFSDILISFLIYLTFFYALLLLLFQLLSPLQFSDPKLLASGLQLLMACLAIPLWLVLFSRKKNFSLKHFFKWGSSSVFEDILSAIATYLISLPIIGVVNELSEQLTLYFFESKGPDQGAVLYLKSVKEDPLMFCITLISIIVVAPLIEEVLFRGLLQRYIKKCLGIKAALLLSSFFFAIMHFQLAQGIGNIPLLISLFIFALYLGFLYEKKKSLVASIALHFIFNLVSVVRIVSV